MKYVKAFLFFLWDFIVGDSPEIAVGCGVFLVLALIGGIPAMAGAALLPAAVAALLIGSVYIGKMQAGK